LLQQGGAGLPGAPSADRPRVVEEPRLAGMLVAVEADARLHDVELAAGDVEGLRQRAGGAVHRGPAGVDHPHPAARGRRGGTDAPERRAGAGERPGCEPVLEASVADLTGVARASAARVARGALRPAAARVAPRAAAGIVVRRAARRLAPVQGVAAG